MYTGTCWTLEDTYIIQTLVHIHIAMPSCPPNNKSILHRLNFVFRIVFVTDVKDLGPVLNFGLFCLLYGHIDSSLTKLITPHFIFLLSAVIWHIVFNVPACS